MAESQRDSKALKLGISIPENVASQAKVKAGANFSAYVTTLITNDLENIHPEPLSSTVIVDLARVLVGELDARKIAKRLEGADQPEILQKWLRELAEKPNDSGVVQAMLDEHARQESPARRIIRQNQQRSNGTES